MALSRNNDPPLINSGGNPQKKTPQNKAETICKHYCKGKCRRGFSRDKAFEGVDRCKWLHPKICSKLFKYGLDKECQYVISSSE